MQIRQPSLPCRQPGTRFAFHSCNVQVARPAVTSPEITAVAVPDISAAVVVSSVVVGITTSLILFCSHFHQIADDTAANKMSPLVRLGTANGVKVICCLAAAGTSFL